MNSSTLLEYRLRSPVRHIGTFARLFHCLVLALAVLMTSIAPSPVSGTQPASATGGGKPFTIVAFGDSLTAGYRLAPSEAFPVKLERALKARGHAVTIANAGVSGDTTGAALERLDWAIPDNTRLVIVELGANDALRGLDPAVARRNLEAIITRIKAKGSKILLAGMYAPRNWGEDYAKRFDAMYADLAKAHGLKLYPFFLEGVAMRADLNLDDGLHPNARGVDVIVERILPAVEEFLRPAGD